MQSWLASFVFLVACGSGGATSEDPLRAEKIDRAKLAVRKLAHEAYPSWAMNHPDKACPDALAELLEYLSSERGIDPWGTPFRMKCGAELPAEARGLAVSSDGPDKKPDTADDIKSWE